MFGSTPTADRFAILGDARRKLHFHGGRVTLHHGDCMDVLARLPANSIDSIVTDPPYHLASVVKRFGAEGAVPAKDYRGERPNATGAYARASRGFMGKCYHPDTEVLTRRGWKRIGLVETGENVATLDPVTRDLVWQPVGQTHHYPFDGDLIAINHRSASQLVTPNHSVVISLDGGESLTTRRADSLPRAFHLFAQANPTRGKRDVFEIEVTRPYGKDRAETRVERRSFDAEDFFRFFGMWLGDGCTVCRADDHPANDFIAFTVSKRRKIAAIQESLFALGVRHTMTRERHKRATFYVYDFALLEWLRPLGDAREKYIPAELFEWDSEVLEHLYQGLIDTDGHRLKSGYGEQYHTSSKRLADDFQRLCLHTGRSCIITRIEPHPVMIQGILVNAGESFACSVLQPGKRLYGEHSDTSSNIIKREQYVGHVVCLGVAEHHILYTRLNGRPVWSGNSWDGGDIAFRPETWAEVLRVLKPGGYLVAFSATRNCHRMVCAIEDAGFEVRDSLYWMFGTGFPKSLDIAKAVESTVTMGGSSMTQMRRRNMGADYRAHPLAGTPGYGDGRMSRGADTDHDYKNARPVTAEEALTWYGWGTALKPAIEPICFARKPVEGTVAQNVLKHGVGGINIDGCRVPVDASVDDPRLGGVGTWGTGAMAKNVYGDFAGRTVGSSALGRWPANVLHDGSEEVVSLFPSSNGGGSAARFFYSAKASKEDRAGSAHPTVKPIALMRWLVRLITPPGGVVLDPFAGTGTTGQAAIAEGCSAVLIEREDEYRADIERRMNAIKTRRRNVL